MALSCPLCRSDLVSVLAGDHIQCVACGSIVDYVSGDKVETNTGPPPSAAFVPEGV